ncbi:LOG family protein [Bacillus sp. DJP31]|uniref:LOG family protein n=1 Tax=Bacillus sp. DJP31 TaxID=3409789 RepID=UPI003BB781A4
MMKNLKSVSVFCGSSVGNHPEYMQQAKKLGTFLAAQNIELIYGGGNVGVMGEISRSVKRERRESNWNYSKKAV